MIPEVSVTVTSQRPGVAGQVTIASNFNTPDGSYQVIRQRSAKSSSRIRAHKSISAFILLPSGFSVLGVGAVADYADGVHSGALIYEQIACNPWVWWSWLNPVAGILSRVF